MKIDSDELRDQDCDDTCFTTRWRIADEIDLLKADNALLRQFLGAIAEPDPRKVATTTMYEKLARQALGPIGEDRPEVEVSDVEIKSSVSKTKCGCENGGDCTKTTVCHGEYEADKLAEVLEALVDDITAGSGGRNALADAQDTLKEYRG